MYHFSCLDLNKRHFRLPKLLLDCTFLSSLSSPPSSSCHSRSPPVCGDLLDSYPSCPRAVAGGGTDGVGHYPTPPLPPPSLLRRLNLIRRGGRVSSVSYNFLQIFAFVIRDYNVGPSTHSHTLSFLQRASLSDRAGSGWRNLLCRFRGGINWTHPTLLSRVYP